MTSIKAITVCVNYSDLLKYSLLNTRIFETIVATSPDDKSTQELCQTNNIKYITANPKHNRAIFNKGKLINTAIEALGPTEWILIYDSDIVIPPSVTDNLNNLDPECIYGMKRKMIYSLQELDQYVYGNKRVLRTWEDDYMFADGTEKLPGCFHLFHSKFNRRYDESFKHAGYSDSAFSQLWQRPNRKVIPGYCLHIGKPVVNWHGRRSRPFQVRRRTMNRLTAMKTFQI